MKVAFNPVGHRTSCYTVTLPGFSSVPTQHNTLEFWQIQMLSFVFVTFANRLDRVKI